MIARAVALVVSILLAGNVIAQEEILQWHVTITLSDGTQEEGLMFLSDNGEVWGIVATPESSETDTIHIFAQPLPVESTPVTIRKVTHH